MIPSTKLGIVIVERRLRFRVSCVPKFIGWRVCMGQVAEVGCVRRNRVDLWILRWHVVRVDQRLARMSMWTKVTQMIRSFRQMVEVVELRPQTEMTTQMPPSFPVMICWWMVWVAAANVSALSCVISIWEEVVWWGRDGVKTLPFHIWSRTVLVFTCQHCMRICVKRILTVWAMQVSTQVNFVRHCFRDTHSNQMTLWCITHQFWIRRGFCCLSLQIRQDL